MLALGAFLSAGASGARIDLKTEAVSCSIETQGARVLSFVGPDGVENLWNADPIQLADDKWAHGGIPICCPWFGRNGHGDYHGTLWRKTFAVVSKDERKDCCELILAREEDDVRFECAVTLRDTLKLELKVVNLGTRDFALSTGFHPYFKVGDCRQAEVGGLMDEPVTFARAIDEVYPAQKGSCTGCRILDKVRDRTILLYYENVTGVGLWNPGSGKLCPGTVPGDSWQDFVCVEPMVGDVDRPRMLKPGATLFVAMGIDVRNGSKSTGYEGSDPRYPNFAEDDFRLPFRAMFIGAHPDDADYQFGATATKLVRAGARVMFVSVCNGDNGHQDMRPADLAARRYLETQAAAKVYGVERYVVMGEHDCVVEPSVDLRKRVTRLIRQFAPHMVVTHRPCDYHADHRAAGQVVQDATYLMGVPLFCSDTPVPETLPFVMYAGDHFTLPRPFRPDLLVLGDDVMERTLKALACHESQLFEWLPPEYGIDPKSIPTGGVARLAHLKRNIPPDLLLNGRVHRDLVGRMFPGVNPRYVDAFEVCEYARPPCRREIDYLLSLGFRWVAPR